MKKSIIVCLGLVFLASLFVFSGCDLLKIAHYKVNVTVTGDGTVTRTPNSDAYAKDDVVTLKAAPDTGNTFIQWGGDASGTTKTKSITVSKDMSVTAKFEAIDQDPVLSYSATSYEYSGNFYINYSIKNEGNVDLTITSGTYSIYGSASSAIGFTETTDNISLPLDVAAGGESSTYDLDGSGTYYVPYYFSFTFTFEDEEGNEFNSTFTGSFTVY